ncbi:MAG: GDP-mannose 4,6-dehydratase [Candidatus Hadarchaeum sp.]|uniref:GDP-mannose 4,6-dehydratase n=1 Tax=Candidatus Hadarchaeum sp. TaxID=2883567 RepID=UPI003D0C177E
MRRLGYRVLVTGVAGFIGSHLAERLVASGFEVVGLDNFSSGLMENLSSVKNSKNFSLFKGDILNDGDLSKAKDVDAIFHLAAQSSVPKSTEDPCRDFEINVRGTINMLEHARREDVKAFIFASSSTVYGEAKILPTPEDHPLQPISNYGASKAAGEAYCSSYCSLYGIGAVSLRYYNIFGPRCRRGVMFDLMQKLRKDKERLEVLGTGGQEKDYLYIDDAVDATLLVTESGSLKGEAFNVGSGGSCTVRNLVSLLLGELGLDRKVKIAYTGGVSWPGDVQRTQADITKLRGLGFVPKVNLETGIKFFVDWYKKGYGLR